MKTIVREGSDAEPAPGVPSTLYQAGDVTYFGLGPQKFAWGERRRVKWEPDRDFKAQKLGIPMNVAGYVVHQIESGGVELLVPQKSGIPMELFSEVSTFPQVHWPVFGPGKPLILDLEAPGPPPAPPPFIWCDVRCATVHGARARGACRARGSPPA